MKIIYKEGFDTDSFSDIDGTFEKVQIRKPILPKVAKVNKEKQIGQRRWATVYYVKDEESTILFTSEKQGEAVKFAKALSIKNIKDYYVSIGKVLFNSDPQVAVISPGKHKPGKWKFIIINN